MQTASPQIADSTYRGVLYAKALKHTHTTQLFTSPRRGITDFFGWIEGDLAEGATYRDGDFRHYTVTWAQAAERAEAA